MTKVSWYVQTNLVQEHCVESIKDACSKANVGFIPHIAIPFSESLELPETNDLLIPYGSTTLIKNWSKCNINQSGLFFNQENLRTSTWVKHLGKRMLNYDSVILPLKDAHTVPFETFFMKPDNDLKDFTGSVVDKTGLKKFVEDHSCGGYTFSDSIPVVLCSAKNTGWEWRLFMHRGEVITGSSYKLKQSINLTKPVSQKVLDFAHETALIWYPDEFYVLDICETDDGLKIVEFNCLNASGFYKCDIDKIVKTVSDNM